MLDRGDCQCHSIFIPGTTVMLVIVRIQVLSRAQALVPIDIIGGLSLKT